ncbi:MAG: VWA domain-containing protein [Chloroflexota bacterium]
MITIRKSVVRAALLLTAVIAGVVIATAQEGTSNVAIILDASGSMQAALGGTTRIDVARESVISTVAQLPAETNTSLWAYGHRLPQDDPAASCTDIEQITPFASVDNAAFADTVRGINAIGYTPISDTLQQAATSFPPGGANTIVLISDGEETCAGDPCAVARDLKAGNVDLVVNTVGFAADDETRAQLQCIAQVTGGVYYDAQDADALVNALQSAAITPTGDVRIVDPSGNPLPDVPFNLTSADSPDEVTNFIGQANVPVGTYNAEARGAELVAQTITVNADETVDIVVNPVPVGQVQLVDTGGNLLEDVRFELTLADGTYIGTFFSGATVPTGDYAVSIKILVPVNTTATVNLGEVTQVVVDTSEGTIRLVDEVTGVPLPEPFFEITQAGEDGRYLGSYTESVNVPPGTYEVFVRSTVRFTTEVTVAAGETVDVPLSTSEGTIRLVDADSGAVLEEPLFDITQAVEGGQYLGAWAGTFNVPPGEYIVNVRATIPFEVTVIVGAGETVDVPLSTAVGTIRLVDEVTGEVLQEPLFEITEAVEGGAYLGAWAGTFDVPPGDYVVRVRWIIPFETTVSVGSGETVDVPLNTDTGTLQLVDGGGAQLDDPLFEIYDVATESYLGARSGIFDVPPGVYNIAVRNNDEIAGFQISATVTAGATTRIDAENQTVLP